VLRAPANIDRLVRELDELGGFAYLAPIRNQAAPLVWPCTRRHLANPDRVAIQNCRRLVFSSDWVARQARRSYGVAEHQRRVTPPSPTTATTSASCGGTAPDTSRWLSKASPNTSNN
jgi:hypothetical protein